MKTFLTNAGRSMSAGTFVGDSMTFTKVQFGNGAWQALDESALREEVRIATALKNPIVTVAFDGDSDTVTIDENGFVVLTASFKNNEIGDAGNFNITEIGYWVADPEHPDDRTKDILYAVCAADESEADFIPDSDARVGTFTYSAYIYVGDVASVTAILSTNHTYARADDLNYHTKNKNNPHDTTKALVGLSEVPNVATNDQAPTFTEAANFENIDGSVNPDDPRTGNDAPRGKETLSVIFGKVKKAISVLADHKDNIGNANYATRPGNPHGTTAEAVGAASANHTHSAADVNRGVLAVKNGGTGLSTGADMTAGTPGTKVGTTDYSVCLGATELPGGMLIQWGNINVDSHKFTCAFKRSFADTNYALIFPTCGDTFIPVWKNPGKEKTGFTMERTFGISSNPINTFAAKMAKLMSILGNVPTINLNNVLDWSNNFKAFWNWFGQLKNFANVSDNEIETIFGASQAADWVAIGKAG